MKVYAGFLFVKNNFHDNLKRAEDQTKIQSIFILAFKTEQMG